MSAARDTPTIRDVALRANVSAATVSRALSSPERVSESTRARIAEAVEQTGYTINQAARSLRMSAARTILIALPDISNPFYSTILQAVVHEAARHDYGVLVATPLTGGPAHWIREYFSSKRVDGLLLFDGSVDTALLHEFPVRGGRLPMVVAYDERPDPRDHAVTTDNREAAMRAVEHLLSLGHTRIGHIIGRSRSEDPPERLIGYRQALQRAGLPVRADWVFQGDYTMASGVVAARGFLGLKDRPTAMFCGNDDMAVGFISELHKHHVECPADVSVIGFDDIGIAANYVPPITTMRQPREEIGRRATHVLIDILEGRRSDSEPVHEVLATELVVRKSTARPAGMPQRPPTPRRAQR